MSEENCCSKYQIVQVQIDGIKDDIIEIKENSKEDRAFYRETIMVMRENLTRITSLSEETKERMNRQEDRLDTQLQGINSEIINIRKDMVTNQSNQNNKFQWVRDFFNSPNMKFYLIALVLILVACGFIEWSSVKDFIKVVFNL